MLKSFLFSIVLLSALGFSAHADDCNHALSDYYSNRDHVKKQALADYEIFRQFVDPDHFQATLAKQYLTLAESDGENFEVFSKLFPAKAVFEIIETHAHRLYQIRLINVLKHLNESVEPIVLTPSNAALFLAHSLENVVPESGIQKRVNDLIVSKGTSMKAIQRALGEMELDELQELVHGGNPLKPTPESLIGQYLSRTGATTLKYRFPTTAKVGDQYKTFGEPKLVIAVSAASAAIYHELFSRPEFLLQHHTPNQGTLMTVHNKVYGSYLDRDSVHDLTQVHSEGAILPHILLPSQEANRMLLISEMGSRYSFLRESWKVCPGYSPMGGYGSCTHWFGNLPVGRTIVRDAKHPGKIDQWASNAVSESPQIGPFGSYTMEEFIRNAEISMGAQSTEMRTWANEVIPLVWNNNGQGANMSLSEMLGPKELQANLDGEYANPGYVVHRLTGNVGNDWVPFVIRVVLNHQKAMDPKFDPQIDAH